MIIIYHNPESTDTKNCLKILETSKHNQDSIKPREKTLNATELSKILKLLKIKPQELIRRNSKVWINKFQHLIEDGHHFTDEEYIKIMIEYQDLIERPIIINGEKAAIGKSPKKIVDIRPNTTYNLK